MLLSIANCIGISSCKKVKVGKMLLLAAICFSAINAAGQEQNAAGQEQTYPYEESQARLIEPKQDVFIVPLVADIQMLTQVRQDYGPFNFDINALSTTSIEEINQFKTNALYKAARKADADVIVAATFNVHSDPKGKKMIVYVSGYPGKFINFRPLKLDKPEDYEWISVVYPAIYNSEQQTEKRQEKATK